ncbi:MAG: ABC transporter permease [Bdellovibrio sp.]
MERKKEMIEELLVSTLRLATPLIFAALGGLFSERSGVIQIGLEGMMLVGALAAATATTFTGAPWLGVSAAVMVGIMWAQIYGFFVLKIKADQIISATALNLLAFGLCPFFTKIVFDSTGSTPSIAIEDRLQSEFMWMALILVVVTAFMIRFTRFGLWIQFAGESPSALQSAGVSVGLVRSLSLALTGALAGLGGASLSISLASSYSPGMTAGRGFMALAALIFGAWRPIPTLAACLLFAFVDAAQIRMQGASTFIPVQLVQIMPYLVTMVALIGFFGHQRVPKGLGKHV